MDFRFLNYGWLVVKGGDGVAVGCGRIACLGLADSVLRIGSVGVAMAVGRG